MKEELKDKLYDFRGRVVVKSTYKLEELAIKISDILCKGQNFTYGKNSIWEEIPSMYTEYPMLGMLVIIGGYGGEEGYQIEIKSTFSTYVYENSLSDFEIKINLDLYLYHLLKDGLSYFPEIEVLKI